MTCTVTMPSDAVAVARSITSDDLSRADYQFPTPFIIELDQGEFFAEEVVRLIPGRRMVAFGTWRGLQVVAKIFFDRKHAGRHLAADVKGVKAMIENKIPTPTLRYEGVARDKKTQVLIFDRLQNAHDLEAMWRQRESNDSMLSILHMVMIELATQHVLGVLQKDMHMGNFLITGKSIYTLDGAQIEVQEKMLSKEDSMNNLALFLSQLGAGHDDLQINLFLYYARARGWLLKPQDSIDMHLMIRKHNDSRWQRFEKKIFRNSTDYIAIKRFAMRGMMLRANQGKEFSEFLAQPDAVFQRSDRVMLKDGRSSTVIKVTLDGRELVVKRYNMKNIWHRLRRALRITRARKSWRLAQKLNLFNISTAPAVAYLESNILGIKGTSYFVSEYINGCDVKKFLAPYETQPYAATHVIGRVIDMLRSLAKLEVTHGDLKSSNIIINYHLQPVLIDLDGAVEHLSVTGLRKAWRSELKRFLRNFEDLPAIHDLFKHALRKDNH